MTPLEQFQKATQQRTDLHDTLEKINGDRRRALEAMRAEGMTLPEIADAVGLTVSYVRSLIEVECPECHRSVEAPDGV